MAHLFFKVYSRKFDEIKMADARFYHRNDIPSFVDEIGTDDAFVYEVYPKGVVGRLGQKFHCREVILKYPIELAKFLNTNFSPFYLVYTNPFLLRFTMDYQKQIRDFITDRTKEGTIKEILTRKSEVNEMCLYAVKFHGSCLKYVVYQTMEICIAAIEQTPSSFQHILRPTEDITEFALRKRGLNLACVPLPKRTIDLCRIAVASDGLALLYVPIEYQTYDICMTAIRQNAYAIQYIVDQRPLYANEAYNIDRNIWYLLNAKNREMLESGRRELAERIERDVILMRG